MAMGVQQDRQDVLIVAWQDMPRSPGHAFYDRLQDVLIKGGFDTLRGGDVQALLFGQDGR